MANQFRHKLTIGGSDHATADMTGCIRQRHNPGGSSQDWCLRLIAAAFSAVYDSKSSKIAFSSGTGWWRAAISHWLKDVENSVENKANDTITIVALAGALILIAAGRWLSILCVGWGVVLNACGTRVRASRPVLLGSGPLGHRIVSPFSGSFAVFSMNLVSPNVAPAQIVVSRTGLAFIVRAGRIVVKYVIPSYELGAELVVVGLDYGTLFIGRANTATHGQDKFDHDAIFGYYSSLSQRGLC